MNTSRRTYLATVAASGTLLAGCIGGDEPESDREQVQSLPRPVAGDPDADVVVSSYEDFSCPHCKTYALEVYPEIREQYVEPGDIRYEHHDFPIPVNQRWSWDAAEAARAVQDRADNAAFFEFSADLYRNQGDYSLDLIRDLAADHADGDEVVEDVQANVYRPVVEADRQAGANRGVQGTPTIVVGNQAVNPTVEAISAAIDFAQD